MSPNVAIARLWCPLGMLLAGVVKLGDLRCAGPVRQRSWRASLCLKKRGTRGVSESGGPMQFISEKFGFWSLARRLTVGAVAQAQRPLPGCIHYTLHAWAAEWGECVWVAEALKSRLPRCVPPCLVAFLVAIQLGVCVGRTWGNTHIYIYIYTVPIIITILLGTVAIRLYNPSPETQKRPPLPTVAGPAGAAWRYDTMWKSWGYVYLIYPLPSPKLT